VRWLSSVFLSPVFATRSQVRAVPSLNSARLTDSRYARNAPQVVAISMKASTQEIRLAQLGAQQLTRERRVLRPRAVDLQLARLNLRRADGHAAKTLYPCRERGLRLRIFFLVELRVQNRRWKQLEPGA